MLNKRLGQHFLRDTAVLTAIADAIQPLPEQTILEIGPGDGALTEVLQQSGATVIALEIDQRFAEKLQQRYHQHPRIKIIHTDALAADWQELAGQNARLVGNLPYNISTPLLLKMAHNAHWLQDCHVMVQKEVGHRVCAAANSADYGRLTVSMQLWFAAQWLLDVAPEAFTPPPAVDSTVLRLQPRPPQPTPPHFEAVVTAAFGQRRKTLKNSLSSSTIDWTIDWQHCPIDSSRRAQSLSVAEFIELAKYCRRTHEYFSE